MASRAPGAAATDTGAGELDRLISQTVPLFGAAP